MEVECNWNGNGNVMETEMEMEWKHNGNIMETDFFLFRTDFFHIEKTLFRIIFFPNGPYYFLKFKEYFLNQQLHTLV